MSLLQMNSAPLADFGKAIISFWYRDNTGGPDVSWTAPRPCPANGEFPQYQFFWGYWSDLNLSGQQPVIPVWHPEPPSPAPLDGVCPMLTFGDPNQDFYGYQWTLQELGQFADMSKPMASFKAPPPASNPIKGLVPPSFIGIKNHNYLRICLQTRNRANFTGWAWEHSGATQVVNAYYFAVNYYGDGLLDFNYYWEGPIANGVNLSYKDVSHVETASPEYFLIDIPITSQEQLGWNHVLVSFDITGTCSAVAQYVVGPPAAYTTVNVNCSCKAWVALNDKDRSLNQNPLGNLLGVSGQTIVPVSIPRMLTDDPRGHAPGYVNGFTSDGPREEFTYLGAAWADPAAVNPPLSRTGAAPPHYECSFLPLPVNGHPIGIPVIAGLMDQNSGLEMAELQIWAGQTLDTSIPAKRRLFIDKDGKPVAMNVAELSLGKPAIRLHGTTNWKQGKNTGSAGIDSEGKLKADGQFNHIGKINRYTPDPALGK